MIIEMSPVDILNEIKKDVRAAIDAGFSKESLIRFIDLMYEDRSVKPNYTTVLNNIEPYRYFLDKNNRWGIIVSLLHNSTEGVYVFYPDTMQFVVKDRFHDEAYQIYEPKQVRLGRVTDVDKAILVVLFLKDRHEPKLLFAEPDRYRGVILRDAMDKNTYCNLGEFSDNYYIDVSINVSKITKEDAK